MSAAFLRSASESMEFLRGGAPVYCTASPLTTKRFDGAKTVGWAKRSVPTELQTRGHGAKAPLPTLRNRCDPDPVQHLRRHPIAVHSRDKMNPRVRHECDREARCGRGGRGQRP